jgi:hypothetical protein
MASKEERNGLLYRMPDSKDTQKWRLSKTEKLYCFRFLLPLQHNSDISYITLFGFNGTYTMDTWIVFNLKSEVQKFNKQFLE